MNRKYIPVGMEIVDFEVEDIITSSGGGDDEGGDDRRAAHLERGMGAHWLIQKDPVLIHQSLQIVYKKIIYRHIGPYQIKSFAAP